ncbi:MAG TPA: hypothetical protein VK550_29765 [Polyangiaceae bacterium]|nr:hypothetical protein [Polyangiaceae bacterium]
MAVIDGPAIPQGGQNTRNAVGGNDAAQTSEVLTIYPEPEAPEVDAVVGAPVLPYLTPDAMLVYCQSRLTGINTQCREIMTRQDKNAKAQAALGDLLSALYNHQDGYEKDTGVQQKLAEAYDRAIEAVGRDTPLAAQLTKDRNQWLTAGGDNKEEMGSLINATKNHQSELNSDAEIDMIRLQSLMSQRQTAIQLTTNIVQSLNDQANKIVANIGH